MPEPMPTKHRVLSMVMLISGSALLVAAILVWTGVLIEHEMIRYPLGGMLGIAAFVDLLVGTWFFRKSQTS